MKNKKRDPLRDRLAALSISKPSEIRIEAPHVKVPQSENARLERPLPVQPGKEVAEIEQPQIERAGIVVTQSVVPNVQSPETEVPRTEHTRIAVAQSEPSHTEEPTVEKPQNEAAISELPKAEVPDSEIPPSVGPRIVVSRKEVTKSEAPENEAYSNEVTHAEESKREVAQKKSPRIKQSFGEVPHDEKMNEEVRGEPRGYFKLAHSVFFDPLLRSLSGDSFRLFLWMSSRAWQFTDSTGALRASVRWITDGTGMSHATVSRALKVLREAGLVEILKHDFHDGNVWQVSTKALWVKQTENEAAATSNRESSHLKMSDQLPQIEGNIKKQQEKGKKTSLLLDASEHVQFYFQHCKPFRKREAELKSYKGLREDFSDEEIASSLEFLTNHGLPETGEICKAPMAYLSYSMSTVLTEVNKRREKQERMKVEMVKLREQKAKEEQEAREIEMARQEFVKTFPSESEQLQVVDAICAKMFGDTIRPPRNIAMNIAINEWFKTAMSHTGVAK